MIRIPPTGQARGIPAHGNKDMLKYIKNFFKKPEVAEVKKLSIRNQIESLSLTEYVRFELNPDICDQLNRMQQCRYDGHALSKKQVKGMVKAVYKDETSGFYYIEVVSVVLEGSSGSRREYVLMEHEIVHIYPSRD